MKSLSIAATGMRCAAAECGGHFQQYRKYEYNGLYAATNGISGPNLPEPQARRLNFV